MNLLVRKFRMAICINVIYALISVGIHVWTLIKVWGQGSSTYIWEPGYQALYVVHRVASVFYYYFYKRMALKLGDPRYYKDSEWLRKEYARSH
ncbi:Transmembrane protein 138 [Trichoplax sp. H2]|nr:Transmembrane protein 138 [Trichoplax sp. H2]|eukprot:RDD41164.1 Transmembrane protein 138 [Trichoplax sp. H2]